jgi:Tol biopolymer transport system component
MPRKDREVFAILLWLVVAISLSTFGCGGAARPAFGTSATSTPTSATNPAPVAMSLSPNSTAAQGAAFTLTVNGSSFVPASVVMWNGSSRPTTYVSSSQLTAQIGASDVATAGQVAVTVFNPAPGGGTSAALAFAVVTPNPAPTATTVSPNMLTAQGPAFTLTVSGSNFVASSVVRWNGSSRATAFVNSSQLTAQIAASDVATLGQASVTVFNPTPGGGTSGALTFTILTPIAFDSTRVLDGSNASGSTANIWLTQGSDAFPLTHLSASNTQNIAPLWSPDGRKIIFMSRRALDGSDSANTNRTANVWIVNADGSNVKPLTKLTAGSADCTDPAWSPDGSKIVFDSSRALDGSDAAGVAFTSNVWVMNADGSGVIPLTKLTRKNADSFLPVWSPDGGKIAFRATRALDGSDNSAQATNLWVMNADGSGVAPLTQLTAFTASANPAWSPDSSKIAFASTRALDGSDAANTNNTSNIWVMNANGSGATALTRLTASGASSFFPVWSPNGSKIAFTSSRVLNGTDAGIPNGDFNLWVMGADGSSAGALTRFTAPSVFTSSSLWSADGSRIAFIADSALDGSNTLNANSAINLWVINADGSAAIPLSRLTASGVDTEDPQWQP